MRWASELNPDMARTVLQTTSDADVPTTRRESLDRRGRSRSRSAQRLGRLTSASRERFQGMMDNVAGSLGYARVQAPDDAAPTSPKDSAKDSDSS